MTRINNFEDLEAWQQARHLCSSIYGMTSDGPFSKDFALRDQIRRAAISILSNIAEGFESRTNALFVELLGRAKGSAGEVRAQLYVALDAGYIDEEMFRELRELSDHCSRKIGALMSYLRRAPATVREASGAYNVEPP